MVFIFQSNNEILDQEKANQQKEIQESKEKIASARSAVEKALSNKNLSKNQRETLQLVAKTLEKIEKNFESFYAGRSHSEFITNIQSQLNIRGQEGENLAKNLGAFTILVAEGDKTANQYFNSPDKYNNIDFNQSSKSFFSFRGNDGKINVGSIQAQAGSAENAAFANFYFEQMQTTKKDKGQAEKTIIENHSSQVSLRTNGLTNNDIIYNIGSSEPFKILYETGNTAFAGKQLSILADNLRTDDQIKIVQSSTNIYKNNEEKNIEAKNQILREASIYSANQGKNDLSFLFSALQSRQNINEKDLMLSANILNIFNSSNQKILAEKENTNQKITSNLQKSHETNKKEIIAGAYLERKKNEIENIEKYIKLLNLPKKEFLNLHAAVKSLKDLLKLA